MSSDHYYSQCQQDEFVDILLGGKRNGVFVDIGCYDPVHMSNSYFFEKQRDWNGLAIDRDDYKVRYETVRPNTIFRQFDLTALSVEELFGVLCNHQLQHVDYLSVDCDEASTDALATFPFEHIHPHVITIEHDAYRFGDRLRKVQRKILGLLGYRLFASDVLYVNTCPFEDWWISNELSIPGFFKSLPHSEIGRAHV